MKEFIIYFNSGYFSYGETIYNSYCGNPNESLRKVIHKAADWALEEGNDSYDIKDVVLISEEEKETSFYGKRLEACKKYFRACINDAPIYGRAS